MPRASRRPAPPRPQTARCRFADDRIGRCRSIATVDGFCHYHARELEENLAGASPFESLLEVASGALGQVFGRKRPRPEDLQAMIEAGIGLAAEHLRARAAARSIPGPTPQPPRPGAPPPRAQQAPPRGGRVAPEAIAARKANIAARGILGFEPDEAITEEAIKTRRRELARVWHTDNAAGKVDPTREAMMRKINAAADLLLAAAQRGR